MSVSIDECIIDTNVMITANSTTNEIARNYPALVKTCIDTI